MNSARGERRGRKVFFLLCAAVAAAILAAAWFGAPTIAATATRLLLDRYAGQHSPSGVEIVNPAFSGVEIEHFKRVTWKGISGEIRLLNHETFRPGQSLSLRIDRADLHRDRVEVNPFILTADGFEVSFYPVAAPSTRRTTFLKKLRGETFSIRFPLSIFRPRTALRQARDVARNVADLIRHGRCDLPVQFNGTADILVWGEPMEVALRIVREGGSSILLMDGEDILRIADGLKMRRVITETEMKLLARNPLKAPKLLELRDRASKISKRAWLIDPATPQDAYRHVLWSYLLTRAYGAEFAREVTDAREIGDTKNTEAQRMMDLNNNLVGQRYAARDVPEDKILELVRTDPEVIRSAD